ncbi:MAG TPA: DNA polymerase III subunit gamma/tau [Thermoanaerobaculia bacterium]|jgi:DNA polymerase-3 subunit gamma/tau|nr:DNA polymerase III subunit gamma/tau [Thermoanaerobaculia bacterium]
MAYQVLARKWRPQDFSSLVGQEAIVTALRNALREKRIAQAYLFSGIRGVGKTTAARVLAKALNCETNFGGDPCNDCTPCREITRGGDLDVIEVDAATYSKVEQVRDLTESLRYGPTRDRYKVVVLDEIHRLSRQAFDALLKIVEEPPPHLVFIFATTEADSVPVTILSRCQEFRFRRVPSLEVAALLRRICNEEEISTSDAALRLVARAGEGSVRDAVALLDQLATFGNRTISDDDAVRLLGGLDTALFHRLLQAMLVGDRTAIREAARRIEDEGWDARNVYSQFLAFGRDALHLAIGGSPSAVDLPDEEAQALARLAEAAGYENLLRLLSQLLASEPLVRRSETGVLAVEIAWLRAAELPKLLRVEELLAGGTFPAAAGAAAIAPKPAPARGATPSSTPSTPPPLAVAASSSNPGSNPAPVPTPAVAPPPGEPLARFLDEVRKRKPPLASHLDRGSLGFESGVLTINYDPGDLQLRDSLNRGSNPQILRDAVAAIWGAEVVWRALEGAPTIPSRADSEAPKANPPAQVDNPTVQTLLELFGGQIEAIEES